MLGNRTESYQSFLSSRNPETGFQEDIVRTGYYLSLLPGMVDSGLISQESASRHASQATSHAFSGMSHHEGILQDTHSTASVIDTTIFLNGCIVAAVAFPDVVIDELLERVRWDKFVTKTCGVSLLSMNWTPKDGYSLPPTECSCENLMPYILAAGSGTVLGTTWYNLEMNWWSVDGHSVLNVHHPVRTATIGLNWLDLKDVWDNRYTDFVGNAASAEKVCVGGKDLGEELMAGDANIRALYMSHPVVKKGLSAIGFKSKNAPYFRGGSVAIPEAQSLGSGCEQPPS